jgi:hypothetical protein
VIAFSISALREKALSMALIASIPTERRVSGDPIA